MKKKQAKNNPFKIIVLLLLVLIFFYSGFQILNSVSTTPQTDSENNSQSKTISRNGIKYYPRQDMTVIMLMGIDQTGPVKASDSYNNDGSADMISLVVFDHSNETYSIVVVNRDTMMDVPILGINGKSAGTAFQQVALSHTYGSGLEDSCENTEKAIADFFYGLDIDYYLSLNMDAISILTDAVGGVKVTVTDDFSGIDPSITTGETILDGEQALTFIQTRKGLGDQLNLSRIERHKEFMNGFIDAFQKATKKDDTFIIKTYDAISDYAVTDCSANTMSSLASRYGDYQLKEIITPEGENTKGEKYMEFYADEEALDKFILDMFYSQK